MSAKVLYFRRNHILIALYFFRRRIPNKRNRMSQGLEVWQSVNISGLNSSVLRALARYSIGPGFESRLRRDFSPPVTQKWWYYYIWYILNYSNTNDIIQYNVHKPTVTYWSLTEWFFYDGWCKSNVTDVTKSCKISLNR